MPPDNPTPTFQFDGFVFDRLLMEQRPKVAPAEGEELQNGIVTDVRPRGRMIVNENEQTAVISLAFQFTPDPKKQPYYVEASIVGRFRLISGTIEEFTQFCKTGAVSILFPFVREAVYYLTRDGRYGPLRINPINLQTMLGWQVDDVVPTDVTSEPSPPTQQSPSAERS